MAQWSAHGGSCCGMRHIYTFREDDERNMRELIRTLSETGPDNNLQQEVILSNRQTEQYPGLVDELARLGFVYTSSWTGQHNTPVHLFLRAKCRLALSAAHFYERWQQNRGMLPRPALAGQLPPWNEQVRPQAPLDLRNGGHRHRAGVRYDYNYLLRGDRVRVNSPRSALHETEQVIHDFYNDRYNYYATFVGSDRRVSVNNLIYIAPEPEVQLDVPQPLAVYRHPNAANVEFPAVRENPPAPPLGAERRLILSQFYCVFRASGLASRVFDTFAEGQQAYPRATQWHERKVFSDGEIVEGPVNHG